MDGHEICSGSQPDISCEQDSTEFIDHHHVVIVIVIVYLMKRKATDATPMIAKTQGPAPTHHKLFHILVIGKGDTKLVLPGKKGNAKVVLMRIMTVVQSSTVFQFSSSNHFSLHTSYFIPPHNVPTHSKQFKE